MLTEVMTEVAGTFMAGTPAVVTVRSAEDVGPTATGVSRGMEIGLTGISGPVMATGPAGNSDLVTGMIGTDLIGNSNLVMGTDPAESTSPVMEMIGTDPVGNSDPATVTGHTESSGHAMATGVNRGMETDPVGNSDLVTETDPVGNSDLVTAMMYATAGNRSMTRGGSSSRLIRRNCSSEALTVRRTERTILR